MSNDVNFYSPMTLADGRKIYGAAAANHRAKLLSGYCGWNGVVKEVYDRGVQIGVQSVLQDLAQQKNVKIKF